MTEMWRLDAACLESDPDLFFCDPQDKYAVETARDICTRCPVKSECYEAGKDEEYGIFGGTTPAMRRRIVREVEKHRELLAARSLAG